MAITQTQVEQQKSTRFALMRITPRRYLNNGATLLDGTVETYVYSFGYPIAIEQMEYNGVTMTRVDALADIIDGSLNTYYYVDEAEGDIYFHVSGGWQQATDHIVAWRHLFYTDGVGRYYHEDPSDSGTDTRFWESRLAALAPIRQSIKNALSGVFTVESSSFRILNPDRVFEREVSADDSFRDCDVKIWFCVDDADTNQLVFSGKGKKLSLSDDYVSFQVYDAFARMRQSCFYGDDAGEAIFSISGGFYPQMDSKRDGEPCRLILGKHSRWRTKPNRSIAFTCELLDPEFMHEAICTNYDPNISTSTNREWTLCRTKDSIRTVTWGTVNGVPIDSGNITCLTFTTSVWATMDVVIGDCVLLSQGGANAWGRVIRIVFSGGVWEVWIGTNRSTTAGFTAAVTVTGYPAVSIIIKSNDGNEYGAFYGSGAGGDFTIAASSTSGGNLKQVITFNNNFEANGNLGATASISGATAALGTLDPGKHRVYFRVRPAVTNASHGTVLKKLCTDAGLATNAASFTAADSAFDADVLMSIPQYDQRDYKSVLEVAQSIVDSTLGYLAINDSVEAVYKLLSAPAAGDTIDDTWFLKGSLSSDVEYGDIITGIYAYNPHDYADSDGIGASSASSSDDRAMYLHKLVNVLQMRHVLDTIASRIDEHVAVKSRPATSYTWRSASRDLLTDISDDLTLEDARVLGGSGSANLRVIGTQKTPNDVAITAIPVEGL